MNARPASRRSLLVAVLLSLCVLGWAAWLRGGVGATAYDTQDSAGRTMGFNDVFSGEHYLILLKNADVANAVEQMGHGLEGWHNWGLVAAHAVLAWLLFSASARVVRWFLLLQPLIFFFGWMGFWYLPIAVADVVWMHTSDREGFVDISYIAILGQGAWFWACAFVFWKLHRERTAGAEDSSRSDFPARETAAVQ